MEPNLQNPPIQPVSPITPNKQVNLLPVIIVGVVMLLLGLGGGYLLFANKNQVKQQGETTQVSPTITQQVNPTSSVSPTTTVASPTPTAETANWKTYTFPNTNVSVKYPQDWTFTSGLQFSPQSITISKQDSQSTSETRVILEIGNIYGGGADSASTFQHSDQFLINATNAYILTDNNPQPSIYVLSSCNAPKKCLFSVPNSKYQIDFYADYFTPGDQAAVPIPTNDANISTAVKILKTVSF